MKNLIARLLLFFIGVPGIIAAALFFPHFLYAPLAAIILLFSGGSAYELSSLLQLPKKPFYHILSVLCGIIPPLSAYLTGLFLSTENAGLLIIGISSIASMILFFAIASMIVFTRNKDSIDYILSNIKYFLFIIIYPGLLSAMLIALLTYKLADFIILWFAAIVFANDSFAWLIGITLGKHRGIFVVSSNKSLEGFIAGLAGSIIAAIIIPAITPIHTVFSFPLWSLALLGFFCAISAVIGDLFESALKRNANIKDSGTSIPGRGGFLDSFDSILATVPTFTLFLLLYQISL
ncbi:MAG TPA: phosphatidate cytidylyltransferase [Spirochaetales bacterium]|nr:phosphatidate cytidylyltransferase [Spirochaetales bacterium]